MTARGNCYRSGMPAHVRATSATISLHQRLRPGMSSSRDLANRERVRSTLLKALSSFE